MQGIDLLTCPKSQLGANPNARLYADMCILDSLSSSGQIAVVRLLDDGPLTVTVEEDGHTYPPDGFDELFRKGLATLTLHGTAHSYRLTARGREAVSQYQRGEERCAG